MRAYSHQGHGPRADQKAGYISATSDSTPHLRKAAGPYIWVNMNRPIILRRTVGMDHKAAFGLLRRDRLTRSLVARVVHSAGYNLFSFTRASAVVNCQSALVCLLLRSASHALTSSFKTC